MVNPDCLLSFWYQKTPKYSVIGSGDEFDRNELLILESAIFSSKSTFRNSGILYKLFQSQTTLIFLIGRPKNPVGEFNPFLLMLKLQILTAWRKDCMYLWLWKALSILRTPSSISEVLGVQKQIGIKVRKWWRGQN